MVVVGSRLPFNTSAVLNSLILTGHFHELNSPESLLPGLLI